MPLYKKLSTVLTRDLATVFLEKAERALPAPAFALDRAVFVARPARGVRDGVRAVLRRVRIRRLHLRRAFRIGMGVWAVRLCPHDCADPDVDACARPVDLDRLACRSGADVLARLRAVVVVEDHVFCPFR